MSAVLPRDFDQHGVFTRFDRLAGIIFCRPISASICRLPRGAGDRAFDVSAFRRRAKLIGVIPGVHFRQPAPSFIPKRQGADRKVILVLDPHGHKRTERAPLRDLCELQIHDQLTRRIPLCVISSRDSHWRGGLVSHELKIAKGSKLDRHLRAAPTAAGDAVSLLGYEQAFHARQLSAETQAFHGSEDRKNGCERVSVRDIGSDGGSADHMIDRLAGSRVNNVVSSVCRQYPYRGDNPAS